MEKQKLLKILGIQVSSTLGDKQDNCKKILSAVENGYRGSLDLIILPEVWTVGWSPDLFKDSAEDLETSDTLNFLSDIAKKYSCYILGGSFITVKDGKYYNTCPVLNDEGELIAHYNKNHLFSYYGCDEGKYVEKGSNPVMVDIKGIKTGITICYDIRFPEIYRAYRKSGAELLVNMAAWPKSRKIHWQNLTSARAIENQCNFIAVTQSGLIKNDEYNLGISRVINYDGTLNSEISENETSMYAELKFDDNMYQFREKCPVLNDIKDKYEVIYG